MAGFRQRRLRGFSAAILLLADPSTALTRRIPQSGRTVLWRLDASSTTAVAPPLSIEAPSGSAAPAPHAARFSLSRCAAFSRDWAPSHAAFLVWPGALCWDAAFSTAAPHSRSSHSSSSHSSSNVLRPEGAGDVTASPQLVASVPVPQRASTICIVGGNDARSSPVFLNDSGAVVDIPILALLQLDGTAAGGAGGVDPTRTRVLLDGYHCAGWGRGAAEAATGGMSAQSARVGAAGAGASIGISAALLARFVILDSAGGGAVAGLARDGSVYRLGSIRASQPASGGGINSSGRPGTSTTTASSGGGGGGGGARAVGKSIVALTSPPLPSISGLSPGRACWVSPDVVALLQSGGKGGNATAHIRFVRYLVMHAFVFMHAYAYARPCALYSPPFHECAVNNS